MNPILLTRTVIGLLAASRIVAACDCEAPRNLCARLDPNMAAFIGRPISTVQLGGNRVETTFRIEERLWGAPATDQIAVATAGFSAPADRDKSWFVLAGSRDGRYFVDLTCCPYGLLLPTDHHWVKEFRGNVEQKRRAAIGVEIQSNWIPLANLNLQIKGPAYSWRGLTSGSAMNLRLPPGDYVASIDSPRFTLPEAAGTRVSILPGSCAARRIPAEPVSRVSGRITGQPHAVPSQSGELRYWLEGTPNLELAPLDAAIASFRQSWQALTGWGAPPVRHTHYSVVPAADGHFQSHVLPGKYRLTAIIRDRHGYETRIYYPGVPDVARATEIDVPSGGEVRNIDFTFPSLTELRRIEVLLVFEDGSPASNQVVAHTSKVPSELFPTGGWTERLTDAKGYARFDVWRGADYNLHILGAVGESIRIHAGAEPISLKFVIRRKANLPRR